MSNKKNKYSVRKPNIFTYAILKIGSWFMSTFFFNVKIIKNETKGVKGPFVVIQNHEAVIDFYSSYTGIKGISYMVMSNSFFQTSKIRKCMEVSGTIPKQQFQTSIGDLKLMKSALEKNKPLIFYPQGLMTEDGIATMVPQATGKALKWFKKDVYVANIRGTYLTSPKWSNKKRRGKPTLTITKLFTKEQLEELSQEEIEKIVEEKLFFDAYKNQEKDMVKYKNGDLIEGIENPLYKCPKCEKEFTIKTSKNKLFCTHCGNKGYADKYGFLHPETKEDVIFKHPSDWSRFIQRGIEEEIKLNPSYELEEEVTISKFDYDNHVFKDLGKGKVTLNSNGYTLIFNSEEGEVNKYFDTRTVYLAPFASGKYFELQEGMDIYRIFLPNPEQTSKWMNVMKTFYRIKNEIKI